MLNRGSSSVTIRPVINETEFKTSRVLFFDKQQIITNNNTESDFLDPEATITDGYNIRMGFSASQKEKAQLLFNQFKSYITTQRIIYSDLDWCQLDLNGPHATEGWEVKFEKAGSQLIAEYGKALTWLLLNHEDIPIYSYSKSWILGENEQRLISYIDYSLYSGAKPKFKQQFFYDPENKDSSLYNWDQQLADSREIDQQASEVKQQEILDFWFSPQTKPKWFARQNSSGAGLDETIKKKYFKDLFLAVNGYYNHWLTTTKGKLAYILLVDQFTRSIYRGTPMIVAYDKLGVKVAKSIVDLGEDKKLTYDERVFCYLPFIHSEVLEEQNLGAELSQQLMDEIPEELKDEFEYRHKKFLKHQLVINEYGRFLHRDMILFGMKLTEEQEEFIKEHDAIF